jgi:hypothetical protein
MEAIYQEYKDIAEFRLIYITEAHAADGNRPTQYAKSKGITQQTNYAERCTTAQMLFDDKRLTIPCLVDSMDNATNAAYSAEPDRVFLVNLDGTLAVAGERGPRGFKPGMDAVEKWLIEYKKTTTKPESNNGNRSDSKAPDSKAPDSTASDLKVSDSKATDSKTISD